MRKKLEEAIREQRVIDPDVVKDRLKQQFKRAPNVEQYVVKGKTLYEFTFQVLSVAQVSFIENLDTYEIDQLWTFTYSNASPQLFCFQFNDVEEKQQFEEIAKNCGKDPQVFAKEILIEKMNSIIEQLRKEKRDLNDEIYKLREERRKSNIAYYQKVMEEFKQRLEKDIPEASGNDNWQTWIYRNNWLFGSQYEKPIDRIRIGSDSIPDFVFPTLDGFIDILEIKKPSVKPLRKDRSHAGSFSWSADISQAIGQVVTYLHKIEIDQLKIAQMINRSYSLARGDEFHVVKPRAFILAGRSQGMSAEEKEAFRKLNYSLNGVEVLTYDDLVRRGKSLIELYTKEIDQDFL